MRKILAYAAIILFLLLIGGGIYLNRYLHSISPRIKQRVVAALEDRFDADVTVDSLKVGIYPEPNVVGEGISIRHRQWPDRNPLLQIGRFYARTDLATLVERSNRVSLVRLEGLTIHIPPRGQAVNETKTELNQQVAGNEPGQDKTQFEFLIQTIEADGTTVEILPKTPGNDPLRFDFHKLLLHSVGPGHPMAFTAKLTNAKPPGIIDTNGTFGPWQRDDPRSSPVSGKYEFHHADLSVFKGISGILASKGEYRGILQAITVEGTTDTPNFALKRGGDSVHLTTRFHATVDGVNGDTVLDPVKARFRNSEFICQGGVVQENGPKGKTVSLDARTSYARMEDILALVVGGKPFVTGNVDFQSKVIVPPGPQDVIDKLSLDGKFLLSSATFTSPKVAERLVVLSNRARGISKQEHEEGQGVNGNVASQLQGVFKLQSGDISFSNLSFGVPGAQIRLVGSYSLPSGQIHMHGVFRMQGTLADTQSGIKQWLLKPLDPLFEKNGAGFEVPVKISGTRQHPEIAADIFHHEFTIN
jgi:hypothetical protein